MTDTPLDIIALATTIGAAIGYMLNWLRMSRKDTYEQVAEATQKLINAQNAVINAQDAKILRLEGRLEQITLQLSQMTNDHATGQAELHIARATIDAQARQISEWERRFGAGELHETEG